LGITAKLTSLLGGRPEQRGATREFGKKKGVFTRQSRISHKHSIALRRRRRAKRPPKDRRSVGYAWRPSSRGLLYVAKKLSEPVAKKKGEQRKAAPDRRREEEDFEKPPSIISHLQVRALGGEVQLL